MLSDSSDTSFKFLTLFHFNFNLLGSLLRSLERINELNIIKYSARIGLFEQSQYIELTLIQLPITLAHKHNILIPLPFNLLPLMLNHHGKQLFLESIEGDGEVDDVGADEYFGEEVGVGEFGEDVDLEFGVVVDVLVPEFYHRHVVEQFCLFGEDWV